MIKSEEGLYLYINNFKYQDININEIILKCKFFLNSIYFDKINTKTLYYNISDDL